MRQLWLILVGCMLLFIQGQLLPALFHTNFLPDIILTAVIVITLFKGRSLGLAVAIIGGLVQDILVSNFFGLHLFPYIVTVYILSFVKHRMYEERWYWTFAFVAICTLLVGGVRMIMLGFSGADIHLSYMWYMVIPTVFWNALFGAVGHGILSRTKEREDYIW